MSNQPSTEQRPTAEYAKAGAFRRAVYRGLSLVAPPLLTVVILFWIFGTLKQFLWAPAMQAARTGLVWAVADVRRAPSNLPAPPAEIDTAEGPFVRIGAADYVPRRVANFVAREDGAANLPVSGNAVYQRYVDLRFLERPILVPVLLLLFVLVLYLLGKLLAVNVGRFFIDVFEQAVVRLPLVRHVYPSVKQVTGLLMNQHESGYTRIVAVEFPSPGTWAIGFVTGESLPELAAATGEPMVSIHVPYPPVLKGSVITVRKSQTIDLNMTVDQAVQYVVSCGVLRPPQQIGTTHPRGKLDAATRAS